MAARTGNTQYKITEHERVGNEWMEIEVGVLWLNPDDIPYLQKVNPTLHFHTC